MEWAVTQNYLQALDLLKTMLAETMPHTLFVYAKMYYKIMGDLFLIVN